MKRLSLALSLQGSLTAFTQNAFRKNLLSWVDAHRRDLPWRQNRDPYRVWLSEIMLQQTRVAAVIAHYHEFLRRFPTVQRLAAAREASVLAAWSGLGYYRRARMLHAAAKVMVREQNGKFPESAKELLKLPGIGRYTAAAIASISFGEACAVVDGNVERVLGRVLGRPVSGEALWAAADELLDAQRPGDFNQAMMELGAMVCTPRGPQCLVCPVVKLCATRGELAGTRKLSAQEKREIHYALHCRDGEVFLVQRAPDAALMGGMWELPEKRHRAAVSEQKISHRYSGSVRNDKSGADFTLRHSITVTDYVVRVWREIDEPGVAGKWMACGRLPKVALTGLARKILRRAEII